MNVLEYNVCAAIHNLALVDKAEKIIRDLLDGGDAIIYTVNPDGSHLKLEDGVRFISINGLGIEYDN